MKNAMLSIAKKEYMDNIRSKWIIIISIIFASLTILVSYAGSLGSTWQDLTFTIIGMMVLVQYLIPIIGLMLGYAAIVGEIERGSMNSLLSFPVTRLEIIAGKFLGLGAVLSSTIAIGFGIAAIVISINVQDVEYIGYLIFIGASILIGLVFLSASLLISSFFRTRSTAMAMAVFSWFFFTIIWSIIMSSILVTTVGLEALMEPTFTVPDWYYGISLINPLSAYSGLVSLNINSEAAGAGLLPSFYTSPLMIVILIIWIIVPLILTYFLFNKKDI